LDCKRLKTNPLNCKKIKASQIEHEAGAPGIISYTNSMNDINAQILYIPHGGGPMPLLGDPDHFELSEFLRSGSSFLKQPEAIIVFSAHWEENQVSLIGSEHPPLLYDYSGFPPESYSITYPAAGNPALVREIIGIFQKAGLEAQEKNNRGFDHGVFVPLKLMYPDANIPVLQISLIRGLDPQKHWNLGKTLQELLQRRILFLGSGFSFHNMREFYYSTSTRDEYNHQFQTWLHESCTSKEKLTNLLDWAKAPHARFCHPREEHLIPLLVCAGLAGEACKRSWNLSVLGVEAQAFLWE